MCDVTDFRHNSIQAMPTVVVNMALIIEFTEHCILQGRQFRLGGHLLEIDELKKLSNDCRVAIFVYHIT